MVSPRYCSFGRRRTSTSAFARTLAASTARRCRGGGAAATAAASVLLVEELGILRIGFWQHRRRRVDHTVRRRVRRRGDLAANDRLRRIERVLGLAGIAQQL